VGLRSGVGRTGAEAWGRPDWGCDLVAGQVWGCGPVAGTLAGLAAPFFLVFYYLDHLVEVGPAVIVGDSWLAVLDFLKYFCYQGLNRLIHAKAAAYQYS